MKLDRYNKKRNFKKTPEPAGKISHKHKFLYVIQKHAASHLHYDFRLELNGVLLSWAVPKGPCLDPSVRRLAMHVEDHPVEYGHFEGIIPKGEYGGGTVMLWDKGIWIPEDQNPIAAYKKGHLKFTLDGEKLKGGWSLIKFKKEEDHSWFLIKAKDQYAKPLDQFDITIEEPNSVLTNYSLDDISNHYDKIWSKKGLVKTRRKKPTNKKNMLSAIEIDLPPSKMPTTISPNLATLVDEPPSGNEWLHELKFDGYRILTFIKNKDIEFISRNNKDWSVYFPNVMRELKKLPLMHVILDGEIVLLDQHQRSNFQLLQNSIKSHADKEFVYYIFDIIYLDKFNLKSLPLLQRKNILKQVIPDNNPTLRYSDHIVGSGPTVFKNACEMKLEGIISKKMDSTYEERRTKSWLKVKCLHRQEFVIGGYSPPKRSRQHFGSLYLGYYDKDGILRYCGNVGTGFNQKSLENIYNQMQKIVTSHNPFDVRPPGVTTATWIKPKLVAEVEFTEWTNDGTLRHPSFKGLRSDKKATAIIRESELPLSKIKNQRKKSNK